MAAPVRGARIVLSDNLGVRADMAASWLAQMGWEAYVLDGGDAGLSRLGVWPGRTTPPRRQPRLLCDLMVVQAARFYLM